MRDKTSLMPSRAIRGMEARGWEPRGEKGKEKEK